MITPVWHRESEMAVIGAALCKPETYYEAELRPSDFFDPKHRKIWSAMGDILARGEVLEPGTVELELGEWADKVGGIAYLSECVSAAGMAVEVYAREIREAALTRTVQERLSQVQRSGARGEELLGLVAEISTITPRKADPAEGMTEMALARFKRLCAMADKVRRNEPLELGVPTGIDDLDYALGGGLPFGAVTILGGRPSDGKSALARGIASHAVRSGFPTHYFSLEDDKAALTDRELADRARINLFRLRRGELGRDDVYRLAAAADELARVGGSWLVDDDPSASAVQIALRVRRHLKTLRTRLVVVDYIQLVQAEGETRKARVDRAIEVLVDLARKEDLAVLVLSQLGRLSEKESRPPRLSDLKESGDLEQVARAVILVWQWELKGGGRGAELRVAKQKHGIRDAKVPVTWDADTATYRPRSWRDEAEGGTR